MGVSLLIAEECHYTLSLIITDGNLLIRKSPPATGNDGYDDDHTVFHWSTGGDFRHYNPETFLPNSVTHILYVYDGTRKMSVHLQLSMSAMGRRIITPVFNRWN